MEFYHVVTRGIDRQDIFRDNEDYFRAVHDLYEFNDVKNVESMSYAFQHQSHDVARREIGDHRRRELLVTLHAFSLMPNHYHLLLSPQVENGMFRYMKKFNGGFARYFNPKYHRKGPLFDSSFKRILVETHAHYLHLPYYIHCNRLDLVMPEWRGRKIRDAQKALEYLANDRWSSHQDYLGKKNFPSLTQRETLLELFGGCDGYARSVADWICSFDGVGIQDVALEPVSQEFLGIAPISRRATS